MSKARLCMSERPRDEEQKRARGRPSISARAEEPRHAKHAHLSVVVSKSANRGAPMASFRGVSGNGGPVNPRRAFRPDPDRRGDTQPVKEK